MRLDTFINKMCSLQANSYISKVEVEIAKKCNYRFYKDNSVHVANVGSIGR